MSQKIKYNTGTTTSSCCVRKGNFEVGIVPTYPYGPTRETKFWKGRNVPVGGFVSYQKKDVQGPSTYQVQDLSYVISYGQNLDLGRTLSTPADVIQACAETDDIMFINLEYPNIPLIDNCVLLMDGGYTASYPWGGSNWYDISGAQQVTGGTVDVTTTFTSGMSGNSYSDSYLTYENTIGTNVPAFGSTLETFTVNIIFNTSGISASQNINIVGQRYSQVSGYTAENDCNFLIRGGGSANQVEGLFRVGGSNYSTGMVSLSDLSGTWVNLTLTYDGTNLVFYVNGVSRSSTTPGVTPVSNGLETLIAGSVNGLVPGTSSNYFNGRINVAQIYNTALNSTQVQELYNTYSERLTNFDVENVDWSLQGVTDKDSFISFILGKSNYSSVNVGYFEYSTTRIRATITGTGILGLYSFVPSSAGITNVNLIGLNNLETLDLSGNQIVTFNPLSLPNGLRSLNLSDNIIVNFNPSLPLPTTLRVLRLQLNQIVTFNPTLPLPVSLLGLLLQSNQIVTFNPTLPLPSSLSTLRLDSNRIVTFNPTLPLPVSLVNLLLDTNLMTTAGYTGSEPWANNQPSFTNPCRISFNGNTNSVTGTNLESILLTKNVIIT